MKKRAIWFSVLMICTQISCVMIYHYSVMDKKMTAILIRNCSHFLVRTKGFAPLAARPDKRLSIVWFAVMSLCNTATTGQTNHSRDFLPPQIPSCCRVIPKKKNTWSVLLFLVRTKGFEPTRCYPQESETCASASFATSACIYNVRHYTIWQANCQVFFTLFKLKYFLGELKTS